MSYFQYGSYAHPAGEVNLTRVDVRNIHSGRGQLQHVLYTMYLQGEICAADASAVTTRINEITAAYRYEGYDAGLYLDSGTVTSHFLQSNHSNNISGNRIIQGPSFPKGGPEEYATGRTFSITIQALFASPESQILEYTESIQYVGTGGPQIGVRRFPVGPPQAYIICQQTEQRIVQSGRSLGFGGYVFPYGPLYPNYEHTDQRVYQLGTPRFHGQQFSEYPMQWAFYMSAPFAQSGVPIPR